MASGKAQDAAPPGCAKLPSDTRSISNCHATAQDARLGVVDVEIPMLVSVLTASDIPFVALGVASLEPIEAPIKCGVGWLDIRLKFDGQGLIVGKDLLDVDLLQLITSLLSEILTSLKLSLLHRKMSIETTT